MNNNYLIDMDEMDQFLSDSSKEHLLMNIADELLIENILEQIEKPINCDYFERTDYFSMFQGRVDYLISKYEYSDETLCKELKTVKINKINIVLKTLCDKYDIKMMDDEMNNETLEFTTKCLYEFFVLNLKENIRIFLTNYILKNKKSIAANYSEQKKDVETISAKKIFKNKSDAVIVANLLSIVESIIGLDLEYEMIMETIIEEDPSETSNYFLNNLIFVNPKLLMGKDFSDRFFSVLKNKEIDSLSIITDISSDLYKILPQK